MQHQAPSFDVDVIVCGMGAAGESAALAAHDAGAEVLIIEKTETGGGNSLVSSAMMIYPTQDASAEQFASYLDEVNRGMTDRSLVDTFVTELLKNPAWFESLGGELEVYDYKRADPTISYYIPDVTFSQLPSAQGLKLELRRLKQTATVPEPTGGSRIWHLLRRAIEARRIRTLMSARVFEVVKDERGRAIGVLAEKDGKQVYCRARRGVVLALGGFEYNDELKQQHLTPPSIGGLGNPSNTGDGIAIAQKAGADMWHMSAEASTLGFRPPDWEAGFALTIRQPGFVYIDSQGDRYLDETRLEAHNAGVETAAFDLKTYSYPRMPSWVIMDAQNAHGPALAMNIFSYNVVVKGYRWSEDNSAEIAAGWIQRATTIDGLAEIIGIPADALAGTLGRYNAYCRQGVDRDFGRAANTLKPLEKPYYAMRLMPLMYNTQGGPRRDRDARVLDPDGYAIPGLYAAGEFGSIWGFRYQTSTNFSEALIYGRIAGRNAAAEA